MQTFKNVAAQGDVRIERIDKIPPDAVEQTETGGRHIVAHSETGHHHWLDSSTVRFYATEHSVSYLDVSAPTPIRHDRPVDGHKPILIQPGKYRVRRQREWTPEGFRRLED